MWIVMALGCREGLVERGFLHGDSPGAELVGTATTRGLPRPPGPTAANAPLVARLTADRVAGEFPLVVSLDASGSDLGAGAVRYTWTFGDGAISTAGARAVHPYVGRGAFEAEVVLEDAAGATSTASVTIDVGSPRCPTVDAPEVWGTVADGGLTELSGIVASRRAPDVFWVHEDSGNRPTLIAIDRSGATLSQHDLPDAFADFEDLELAVDPATSVSTLFLGDLGDNSFDRDEVAVWIAAEPDPLVDGALPATRMELTYPDGPQNVETLLVDPLTLDVYVLTKADPARVYVKHAPHEGEGPFELEALGERASIPHIATGGDVSADGTRLVVRDYTTTARLWFRDAYLPLEDAFDGPGCDIGIHGEQQGEGIGFTTDGGVLTVSEGTNPQLYHVGLR